MLAEILDCVNQSSSPYVEVKGLKPGVWACNVIEKLLSVQMRIAQELCMINNHGISYAVSCQIRL